MPTIPVQFVYLTGLKRGIFRNGRYSDQWLIVPMRQMTGDDGCPSFKARVREHQKAGETKHLGIE